MKGFYGKKSTEPKKYLKEYRVENISNFKEGNEIGLEIFKDVKFVDVTSKSIGKGFAGVMKRHNFSGLRASHGVSISHRSGGSTGQRQDPGKVFKGRKMAGHMGDKFRTTLNLEIIKSDLDNDLIYLKGSIPGSKNALVFLKNSVKKINKKTILEKNKIVEKQDKNPEKMNVRNEKKTTKVEEKKEDILKKVEKKDIKSE
jgi:large subunit ribosomal protein L3